MLTAVGGDILSASKGQEVPEMRPAIRIRGVVLLLAPLIVLSGGVAQAGRACPGRTAFCSRTAWRSTLGATFTPRTPSADPCGGFHPAARRSFGSNPP